MDKSRFTATSPGTLVPVKIPENDWSFIPAELPPDWEFPTQLWPLLGSAKEALGTLNGIGQTLPNPQLLLKPLQNREAIASSSIEGTHVTPEQLLLYELDPREPRAGDEQMADWLEVFNYSAALRHGCQRLSELPLCNRLIKEMHEILMRGVRGRAKSPGEFRQCPVKIGSHGRFVPPPHEHVERLLSNLEKYMNSEDQRFDPLVRCYLVHYQFEAIHPFRDGNGRVGRSLLALMTYKWLEHAMPWLYMSSFFEEFRDEYVDNLFAISTIGNWENWIEYCLRGTIVQAKDSVRRCNAFNVLRSQLHERIQTPSPRSHKIVEGLFSSPVVTVPSLATQFDIAYPTARIDIDKLLEAGILAESADTHPKSFYAPEILAIAYGDTNSVISEAELSGDKE